MEIYLVWFKLHPSHQVVREDKSAQTLVISVRLRLAAATTHPGDFLERNPELALLLGCFRGDVEVIWLNRLGDVVDCTKFLLF